MCPKSRSLRPSQGPGLEPPELSSRTSYEHTAAQKPRFSRPTIGLCCRRSSAGPPFVEHGGVPAPWLHPRSALRRSQNRTLIRPSLLAAQAEAAECQRPRHGESQVRQQAPYVACGTAEAPLNSAGTDVGCGSLADGHHSHQKLGGKPRSVTAFGRDGPLESSSLGTYIAAREGLTAPAPLRWTAPWGTQWGQTDGREALGPGLSGRGGGSPFGRASGFGLGPFQPTILPFGACGCPWGASGPIPPLRRALGRALFTGGPYDSYLVDSASSHMLVSKIKPCMSKYKQLYCETANGSLNQLSFI